eukprot:CAMPEP_0196762866 /NCGR_PEP_ID=MMETSP1095-20130614/2965_1 /TAXON_ID=96789 ORGANISM="Chromulina nebulosa, Strain UTEXLB2642" /NCGR_SAMPLE_ID=MMETSP1095 /ASSEMBLY_ACC=CAM_ASM_000446 /LENGTH=158 /DNA_ID=CAMNT_0042114875 /DNA_START=1342 /DNA_END=1815 /DNA_ORIENTATION=+
MRNIHDEREKVRSGDSPIKEDVDTSSLYGSETNDLETEMLEKIVEKLVRIVQHVLPNHSIDMDIESNKHLDSNTASWLNQNYTNKHDSQTIKPIDSSMSESIDNSMNLVNEHGDYAIESMFNNSFNEKVNGNERRHSTSITNIPKKKFSINSSLFHSW